MDNHFDIPILFLVFNRPETTKKVFNVIKGIKPTQLYIAADGPREGNTSDHKKCAEVINFLEESLDWPCSVQWLKRNMNLGCGPAVSSAISWFFENVDMGIILEDDCLPHPFFFQFCKELLIKYKNNSHITHINGYNCQNGIIRGNYSYYFSRYFHVWGWATWKRAWRNYSYRLKNYETFIKEKVLLNIFNNKYITEHWLYNFNLVNNNKINTWDYQWVYSNFINDSIAITPNINLIENIGMNNDGTHSFDKKRRNENKIVINNNDYIEIRHPPFIYVNYIADKYTYKKHVGINLLFKIKYYIKKTLKYIGIWRKQIDT